MPHSLPQSPRIPDMALENTDGPVLAHINKRIRNLRKKLKRIAQLEESIAQGKSIIKNKEQEELLKSKPTIIAVVEELEKSRQPLSVAVDEEITLALKRRHNDNDEACKKAQTLDGEPALPVDDVLSLIYFGSLFDMKRLDLEQCWEERSWCLAHDGFLRDGGLMLGDEELDAISMLSSLMISKPVDCSLVSHQDAIQRCVDHAKHWICKSQEQIDPNSDFTYADVREILTKIMRSGYYKNAPAPGEDKYEELVPDHLKDSFLLTLKKREMRMRRKIYAVRILNSTERVIPCGIIFGTAKVYGGLKMTD